MSADALATLGAKASSGMVYPPKPQIPKAKIPSPASEELIIHKDIKEQYSVNIPSKIW